MKSESSPLKTVVKELDFLKYQLLNTMTQWNITKKDLQLLTIKLAEKMPDPHNAKNTISHSKKTRNQ